VGVAVTSVPVVSKIFADLKILHTRFARLFWRRRPRRHCAVARAGRGHRRRRKSRAQPARHVVPPHGHGRLFRSWPDHRPRIIKRINKARFNVLAKHSPAGYAIAVLLAYCAIAGRSM